MCTWGWFHGESYKLGERTPIRWVSELLEPCECHQMLSGDAQPSTDGNRNIWRHQVVVLVDYCRVLVCQSNHCAGSQSLTKKSNCQPDWPWPVHCRKGPPRSKAAELVENCPFQQDLSRLQQDLSVAMADYRLIMLMNDPNFRIYPVSLRFFRANLPSM